MNMLQLLYFTIISEKRFLITVVMTMGENQDTEENLQALNMKKCLNKFYTAHIKASNHDVMININEFHCPKLFKNVLLQQVYQLCSQSIRQQVQLPVTVPCFRYMENVGSFSLAAQEGVNYMKMISYLQNDIGILIVQACSELFNSVAMLK